MNSMVPETVKTKMQSTLERMREKPGFSSRRGQMLMFAEVAKTIHGVYQAEHEQHRSIVIEGQTGAGKTLGYLLPAICSAQKLKKQVIVATANVALQQQIMNHDLPLLRKAGLQFEQAFVAGRGRYFCKRDAEAFASDSDVPDLLSDQESMQRSQQDRNAVEKLVRLYDSGKWNGLKDDYPGQGSLDKSWWSQINANRDTCSRRMCPYYHECAFFKARKDVRDADIVVTNHAMLYSDRLHVQHEMRLLPSAEDSILIFDEAHHVRDSFRSSLAATLNLADLSALDRNSGRLISHLKSLVSGLQLSVGDMETLDKGMRDDIKSMASASNHLLLAADALLAGQPLTQFKKPLHRFEGGQFPQSMLDTISEQLQPALDGLLQSTSRVLDKVKEKHEQAVADDSRLQNYLASCRNLQQQLQGALDACVILKAETNSKRGIAKWMLRHSANRIDVSLHATPLNVGTQFEREIVNPSFATIFTSATLQTLGNFKSFSQQLSLYPKDGVQFLVVQSPFDYTRAECLTFSQLPEPNFKNEEQHTKAILKRFASDLESHRAALMLFASRRQMQSFADALPKSLQPDALIQYSAPRDSLIRAHKKRIDSGKRSILIGCQSFSEGLDLPGEYLTFVGIAKLPFADINCPIAASESEFVEAQGLHPFSLIMLPDASRRLIQCVGRLMRSTECHGKVAIYDSRLQTKGYGRQLINCLPPMRHSVITGA